jgi:DNA-binding XRE family transcriptional regulator
MKNPATQPTPGSGPTITAAQASAGSLLRARRKLLGMTQEQLAAKVRCSWSHVKRVERGVANPSPKMRAAFAAALDTDPAALFANFPPPKEEREEAAIAARRAQVDRLYSNLTSPELAALLGVSAQTICRDVHALGREARPAHTRPKYEPTGRLCQRCGKPLRFRHPSDHANLRGLYHRECYEQGGVVNKCPICGRERYRPRSQAKKVCCSYSHASRYRWNVSRAGLRRFIKSRRSGQGRWSGEARQRWGRLLGGASGGAPTLAQRDEASVLQAGAVALDCYRRNAETPRRDVVHLVAYKLDGREAFFDLEGRRRDARDPVRRRAEKRAVRRLEAAAQLPTFAQTLIAREFG